MCTVELPSSSSPARRTVIVLGFATAVAQALLLREAMAAMAGSELAWGSVMALWLIGMGAGSRCGTRWGSDRLVHTLPIVVMILAGIGVVLFRAAPAVTGAAPGETLTTWHAVWLWVIAVLPAAAAGGLAFPILADGLGGRGAGRAYALEAIGALAGGLMLSFVLAPLGAAAAICVGTGLVAAAVAWPHGRIVAVVVLATSCAAAEPAGNLLAKSAWRWVGHPGFLAAWKETRHQRIELASGTPTTLYADGRLVATFPDPFTTVPRAHLLMLLHPHPKRVFALGCLTDGSVGIMAEHPVDEIVTVEEDPQLVKWLPRWYGREFEQSLMSPRVRTVASDPLRVLPSEGPWDLVVLRDGNPTTIRHNRTRSLEFFRACHRHMTEDGVLVVRVEVSDTYLGGSAGRLLEVLASTLRQVFPQLVAVPGEEVLLVAGRFRARLSVDPAELERRWLERDIPSSTFAPDMLTLMVDPSRAEALDAFVGSASAPVNTTGRPRAVLLAAGLLEARSRPSILRLSRALEGRPPTPLAVGVGILATALLALAFTRQPPASATAAVVGLCSMGWWLLLIASWQATLGSVYAEIGALTAAFMGGLAAGSLLASRWSAAAGRVPVVLGIGAALSIMVALELPMHFPAVVVPGLLVAGGFLTGAAFPGLADLAARGQPRRGAGIAFAADEAGAAAAAFVIGIVALPWAGLTATAAGLAVLEIAAIPAVIVALRGRRN
jgi:spermidine synthase